MRNKHMNDLTHNQHLSQNKPGLKREEHITYRELDGKLRKETITRVYFSSGGYMDNSLVEIICDVS